MAELPTLILNPRGDPAFVRRAREVVSSTAGAMESALRRWYPRARVIPRDLSGEYVTIWYVYRDGRWTRDAPGAEGGPVDAERSR